ncbi:MAG: LD-carboxypeptidase [Candidatus Kapabacteria bacterium]|nr:LD-carboxypeptidase [Candidatus Kapabacteria bacterium]
MDRRKFIGLTFGATVAAQKLSSAPFKTMKTANLVQQALLPPFKLEGSLLANGLTEGSVVAITAPASPTTLGEIKSCINFYKKFGCKVEIGSTITNTRWEYRYFSAPDDDRANEFNSLIARTDVDAIICARGGYGTMRILPLLDFSPLLIKPKIIMGFSDITALLIAINKKTNLTCFHGPVGISNYDQFTTDYLKKLILNNKEFTPIKIKHPSIQVMNKGKATGRLIGGNLSMLVSTLGTAFEIDTKDSILFIEEVSEHPYKIDRMLTQLWLAGKFDSCCAIIFGQFASLDSKKPFQYSGSFTLRQVFEYRVKELGIPAIIGLPIGHEKSQIPLPIGTLAELDTNTKTLTILESSVTEKTIKV